jgi:hypothetical protein
MANSRDFTGKNRKFTGTKGIVTPKGTTGERVGSESGELRFNTTTELMEYYDGNQWKPIDAPPTISNITTSDAQGTNNILNADGSTLYTITINGGNFSLNCTVKFIGNTGTEYSATNVTRVSASQITCKTTNTMGTTDDPYDVRVTNTSGLSATLDDAFSYNAAPVFTVASGQLGEVYNTLVVSGTTLNAGATDAEGNSITHTIISGALPGSGLSISSSTGAITGTLSGSPTLGNYPFVVRASTTEGVVERQFSLQVVAIPPVSADYLIVAGGGGTISYMGGGGGAGGMRTGTVSLTVGNVYTATVGSGGAAGSGNPGTATGNSGINSSLAGTGISTVTSTGGGAGGSYGGNTAQTGGSGGGQGSNSPGAGAAGTSGQGSAGGSSSGVGAGGGGGKSAVGSNGTPAQAGNGGAGAASSITGSPVNYAGGGGGGTVPGTTRSAGGLGGGGAGGVSAPGPQDPGTPGTANTGGGGGGAGSWGTPGIGSAGGTGVVILSVPTNRYSGTTTGSPTISTSGSNTIIKFTGTGSYTA